MSIAGSSERSFRYLSAIERGKRKPTLETLYRICVALDVSMSEVVAEIESRMNSKRTVS